MSRYPTTESDFAAMQAPGRVSILAILSLVSTLLCIPPMGIIGAVLGICALPGINRSGGRVAGRTLALTAIGLGFLTTLGWIALLVGAGMGLGELNQYGRAMQAIQQADYGSAKPVFEVPSNSTIPDEQLVAFGERVTNEWGALQGLPSGVGGYVRAYLTINMGASAIDLAEKRGYTEPFPVPARFDRGVTTMVLIWGTAQLPSGFPKLVNLGVQAADGSMIWLSDFEPAP